MTRRDLPAKIRKIIDEEYTTAPSSQQEYDEQVDEVVSLIMKEIEESERLTVEEIEKEVERYLRNVPVAGQLNPCNAIYLNDTIIKKLAQVIHEAQERKSKGVS